MKKKCSPHYFDHDADIGIIGYGATIEAAFVDAAQACFAMMADLSQVTASECFEFEFVETDNTFALVIWLNRLLGEARARGLILAHFSLRHENDHWFAKACGEVFSQQERGIEVKGATLTMLEVSQSAEGWKVSCVVDV